MLFILAILSGIIFVSLSFFFLFYFLHQKTHQKTENKNLSPEDQAFEDYAQQNPNKTLQSKITWDHLTSPSHELLRLLALKPSDLRDQNPDLVVKKFIIKTYGLTAFDGRELDDSEIECYFADKLGTIKIRVNEEANQQKIATYFSTAITYPDLFNLSFGDYTCYFGPGDGVTSLATFQQQTEDLFYQRFGPKQTSSTFSSPLQQPKPINYNAFCNELKALLPSMWHPLFEQLKKIGADDNQIKAMNRILGFAYLHQEEIPNLVSFSKQYSHSNDLNFLRGIYLS